MGWISDAVSTVGNTISSAVSNVAGGFGDFVADLINTAMEAIEAATEWVEEVVEDLGTTIGHLGRAIWDLVNLDFNGAIREFYEVGRSLLEFINDWTFGVVGLVIQIGAIILSGFQVIFGMEDRGRKLDKTEINHLVPIFGESINYSKVVIVEGKIGVFNNRGGVVTIGNKIRVPSSSAMYPLSFIPNHPVLVHEIVHVWQYQNGGPRYISLAVIAQLFSSIQGKWVRHPGNNPTSHEGIVQDAPRGYSFVPTFKSGGHWDGLNPEQQGNLIDAAFSFGMDFNNPDTFNFEFPVDGDNFSNQLKISAEMIKDGRGVPIWPPITLPLSQ